MNRLFLLALCLFSTLFLNCHAFAAVLVVSPHPDDEALMFSGVIRGAVQRGESVKVVLMTNGDLPGVQAGYTRQQETVAAMALLGVAEDDVIFLGYPDGGLKAIYDTFTRSTDAYLSTAGQTQTYGIRGLGRTDYHTFRFGAPARYNRVNVLTDLQDILGQYQPQHIFLTGEYDRHDDHSIEHVYLRDALRALMPRFPDYRPLLHSTIIHGGNDSAWPPPANPATPFSEPPLMSWSPLKWSDRESILVPREMRVTPLDNNLKSRVIARYATQVDAYLRSFVHRDEIFWPENIYSGNRPPVASAGADQIVGEGTQVTLDGSGSFDPEGSQLSYRWTQVMGPVVTLTNPRSSNPGFTAPSPTAPLVFQLEVGDGSLTSYPSTVTVTYSNLVTVGVTTSVNGSGSISCTPGTSVTYNTPVTCTVAPAQDNAIAFVTVDGVPRPVGGAQTLSISFGPMVADHVVVATFVPSTVTVSFSAGANGWVEGPTSQTLPRGGSTAPVTAIAAAGYHFVNWTGAAGFTSTANPLVLADVTTSRTITANFAAAMYGISVAPVTNGAVSPASAIVRHGETATFTVAPAAGFRTASVTGCGGTLGGSAYTTGPVTADCILRVTFSPREFSVTGTVTGGSGTISCPSNVAEGGAAVCAIAPSRGYVVAGITDNGTAVASDPGVRSYAISAVTSNHEIAVNFASGSYTLNDAVKAQQLVLGKVQVSDEERFYLDVAPLGRDGKPQPNGVVDVADVVIMLRKLVGIINW